MPFIPYHLFGPVPVLGGGSGSSNGVGIYDSTTETIRAPRGARWTIEFDDLPFLPTNFTAKLSPRDSDLESIFWVTSAGLKAMNGSLTLPAGVSATDASLSLNDDDVPVLYLSEVATAAIEYDGYDNLPYQWFAQADRGNGPEEFRGFGLVLLDGVRAVA